MPTKPVEKKRRKRVSEEAFAKFFQPSKKRATPAKKKRHQHLTDRQRRAFARDYYKKHHAPKPATPKPVSLSAFFVSTPTTSAPTDPYHNPIFNFSLTRDDTIIVSPPKVNTTTPQTKTPPQSTRRDQMAKLRLQRRNRLKKHKSQPAPTTSSAPAPTTIPPSPTTKTSTTTPTTPTPNQKTTLQQAKQPATPTFSARSPAFRPSYPRAAPMSINEALLAALASLWLLECW